MTIDSRWTDIDKMLQPTPKSQEELQERVIADVAQARFEFPTPEQPGFRTYVNVPEVTMPITDLEGNEHTPHIVVVDTPGNVLQMLAQVEITQNITEERAREAWAPLANLPDSAFYLFVPVGQGGRAKSIGKKLGIPIYGYRTWRYVPQGVEINEISEPPNIIHALMPPFARRLMRGLPG